MEAPWNWTVYRLISSPQWVAQDSLFPTDPQLIADIHQAVLDEALPAPNTSQNVMLKIKTMMRKTRKMMLPLETTTIPVMRIMTMMTMMMPTTGTQTPTLMIPTGKMNMKRTTKIQTHETSRQLPAGRDA